MVQYSLTGSLSSIVKFSRDVRSMAYEDALVADMPLTDDIVQTAFDRFLNHVIVDDAACAWELFDVCYREGWEDAEREDE